MDALEGTGFSLIRRIGAGGMGEVFEAERHGTRFVVKVMHPELAQDPTLVDRMRIEGELLAKLRHPNLVAVFAFGCTAQARPFVVMEKLEGRTLHEELEARGPLPATEAIELVVQLLSGIAVLHRSAVIHRDLKPDNVFVCTLPDGSRQIKLLDLGIAKVLDAAAQCTGLAPPEFRTRAGAYVGTPSYAAPEQLFGGAIDHRTDVYGAALVLYQLLTGRSPLEGAAAGQIVTRFDPVSRHAPHPVPEGLEEVIARALAVRAEDRFGSAEAFAEALRQVVGTGDSEGLAPLPPGAGLGRAGFAAVVLATATVTASACAWLLLRLAG